MMPIETILFWVLSWGFVLGLTSWAYSTILRGKRHFDPDGIGPEHPPEPGRAERRDHSGR
jgi:hypothetical protein